MQIDLRTMKWDEGLFTTGAKWSKELPPKTCNQAVRDNDKEPRGDLLAGRRQCERAVYKQGRREGGTAKSKASKSQC